MNKISCVGVVYHQFVSSRMEEMCRLFLFFRRLRGWDTASHKTNEYSHKFTVSFIELIIQAHNVDL